MSTTTFPADSQLERTARRRAGMKMGWFIHAAVYIAVNAMLAAFSAMSDRSWAIYPALGWGLGLAIHGIVVYLLAGGTVYEDLVERERQRLGRNQGPW
jgi:hypothetical protein